MGVAVFLRFGSREGDRVGREGRDGGVGEGAYRHAYTGNKTSPHARRTQFGRPGKRHRCAKSVFDLLSSSSSFVVGGREGRMIKGFGW